MSLEDDDNDGVAPYRVGYSKPPQEHRFEKGRSGNPKGRPRKARKVLVPSSRLLGSDELTTELILEEAYRNVRVRVDGKVVDMPANQAIFRAMQQNALTGNRFAQLAVIKLTLDSEKQRQQSESEYFTQLLNYKFAAEQVIARCKKLGIDPPDMIPHSDDIEIDPRRGFADVHGPVTPEEKKVWDLKLARRDKAANNVRRAAHRHKQLRDPKKQKVVMEEWVREQEVFDGINDRLPLRYKKTLANRVHSEAKEDDGGQPL